MAASERDDEIYVPSFSRLAITDETIVRFAARVLRAEFVATDGVEPRREAYEAALWRTLDLSRALIQNRAVGLEMRCALGISTLDSALGVRLGDLVLVGSRSLTLDPLSLLLTIERAVRVGRDGLYVRARSLLCSARAPLELVEAMLALDARMPLEEVRTYRLDRIDQRDLLEAVRRVADRKPRLVDAFQASFESTINAVRRSREAFPFEVLLVDGLDRLAGVGAPDPSPICRLRNLAQELSIVIVATTSVDSAWIGAASGAADAGLVLEAHDDDFERQQVSVYLHGRAPRSLATLTLAYRPAWGEFLDLTHP